MRKRRTPDAAMDASRRCGPGRSSADPARIHVAHDRARVAHRLRDRDGSTPGRTGHASRARRCRRGTGSAAATNRRTPPSSRRSTTHDIAQERDGGAGHGHERALVVERRAQRLPGLDDEVQPPVGLLRLATRRLLALEGDGALRCAWTVSEPMASRNSAVPASNVCSRVNAQPSTPSRRPSPTSGCAAIATVGASGVSGGGVRIAGDVLRAISDEDRRSVRAASAAGSGRIERDGPEALDGRVRIALARPTVRRARTGLLGHEERAPVGAHDPDAWYAAPRARWRPA